MSRREIGLLLCGAAVGAAAVIYWPWRSESFEECVLAVMKGRPSSMIGFARKSCEKHLPPWDRNLK